MDDQLPALATVQLRHARHYTRRLTELGRAYDGGGSQSEGAVSSFGEEQVQLSHAFQTMTALAEKVPSARRLLVELPRSAPRLLDVAQDRDENQIWLNVALATARQAGDQLGECHLLGRLGNWHNYRGDYAEALRCYDAAITLAMAIGDKHQEQMWRGNTAAANVQLTRLVEAQEAAERALELARTLGDSRNESTWLSVLSLTHLKRGAFQEAQEAARTAISAAERTHDLHQLASAFDNYGKACADLDDHAEAVCAHERSIELARRIGARRQEAAAIGNLGTAFRNSGAPERALECHQRALAMQRKLNDLHMMSLDFCDLATALSDLHRHVEAEQAFEEALELQHRIGVPFDLAITYNNYGRLMLNIGDRDRARTYYTAARALYLETRADHEVRRVDETLDDLRQE